MRARVGHNVQKRVAQKYGIAAEFFVEVRFKRIDDEHFFGQARQLFGAVLAAGPYLRGDVIIGRYAAVRRHAQHLMVKSVKIHHNQSGRILRFHIRADLFHQLQPQRHFFQRLNKSAGALGSQIIQKYVGLFLHELAAHGGNAHVRVGFFQLADQAGGMQIA